MSRTHREQFAEHRVNWMEAVTVVREQELQSTLTAKVLSVARRVHQIRTLVLATV